VGGISFPTCVNKKCYWIILANFSPAENFAAHHSTSALLIHHMRKLLPLLLTLILAPLASAQVAFTVNVTAGALTGSATGYSGSYTLSFVLNTNSLSGNAGAGGTNFDSGVTNPYNQWGSEGGVGVTVPVWTSITGNAVNGTYTQPTGSNDFSFVSFYGTTDVSARTFDLRAEDESLMPTMGLTTPNGSGIGRIEISIKGGSIPAFTYNPSYVDATGYFNGYLGTYSGFTPGTPYTPTYMIIAGNDGDSVNYTQEFTVNSLTISAIPEPSTYAALFGLAALGLVAWLRRRQSA
jgi:hypothetical protein